MLIGIKIIMENNSSPVPVIPKPEILAPAGDKDCFLAALAAGADAIYLGLKNFSARMEAENFGLGLLARLIELAHGAGCRVYVAMNNLLKPAEMAQAYRLTRRLATQVMADGLIIQDLAMLDIARQADFRGMIALSTLANVSSPDGLASAARAGADRVILPRELSIDEIRQMDAACPSGLGLECFAHGALCYCVSGRCYWSSYLGGKSGLRGRCAQPCRRIYARGTLPRHKAPHDSRNRNMAMRPGSKGQRYFACQDLEIGVLIKTIAALPNVVSWKIEGRKKGPHYVFHTVTAYKILRDNPGDRSAARGALEILEMALGRPGVKANFLPQSARSPMAPDGQTSSGLLAGKIVIGQNGSCAIKPRFELLPKDYLRIGVEDEKWHATLPVTRPVPKAGNLPLKIAAHKTPKNGVPVYLIDRREPELTRLLGVWDKKLRGIPEITVHDVSGAPVLPKPCQPSPRPDFIVRPGAWERAKEGSPSARASRGKYLRAVWLSRRSAGISGSLAKNISFWLPPAIWPDDEEKYRHYVEDLWRKGARHFVCNAPWQRGFFPDNAPGDADLVAGPFCNTANALALKILKQMGFAAAFVSPELPRDNALALPEHSPLPLGYVIRGYWPVGISRFGLVGIKPGEPFFSPKGEAFWARDYGGVIWLYPAWPLDLEENRKELQKAGYSFFACLEENPPREMPVNSRPGLFNWNGNLL